MNSFNHFPRSEAKPNVPKEFQKQTLPVQTRMYDEEKKEFVIQTWDMPKSATQFLYLFWEVVKFTQAKGSLDWFVDESNHLVLDYDEHATDVKQWLRFQFITYDRGHLLYPSQEGMLRDLVQRYTIGGRYYTMKELLTTNFATVNTALNTLLTFPNNTPFSSLENNAEPYHVFVVNVDGDHTNCFPSECFKF